MVTHRVNASITGRSELWDTCEFLNYTYAETRLAQGRLFGHELEPRPLATSGNRGVKGYSF